MKRARPLLALLFVGLILIGLYRSLEFPARDRPAGSWEQIRTLRDRDDVNLVMIVVDTLRADRLSGYGYERPTSPILDALADTGIRFENALAQSTWTKTSMASLMTATYPSKNRITRFNHIIPKGATIAPEILQRAGFKTVGIWRNGWVGPDFGFAQGYDMYLKPLPRLHDPIANPSVAKLEGTDQIIIDAAAQFLRSGVDRRFFLYVHLMDVHQYVYDGAVDFGTKYSDIYDQAIHWVDANIGTLIAILQQQGLMEKTVVAIVSDHGEAFYEHGVEGHAKNLYIETTRVPLVITLPFLLEEPVVVRTPVENIDVWPTLLDLLGLPELPEADGRSLLPLIEAAAAGREDEPRDGPRIADLDKNWGRPTRDPQPLVLIEDDRFRFYQVAGDDPELFEIPGDDAEQNDVAAEHPEVVERFQQSVRTYLDTPAPSWGGPGWVTIDEMDARQLRALGYVFDPHAPPEKRELER